MSKKTTSPTSSKSGCLCEDGKTYSKECCEGKIINQGIGSTDLHAVSHIENVSQERVLITEN